MKQNSSFRSGSLFQRDFAHFLSVAINALQQPSIEFLLDQRRILKQSDNLLPHDLVEEILAHQAGIVAHRTAQFSPAFRANTFVIVENGYCRPGPDGIIRRNMGRILS